MLLSAIICPFFFSLPLQTPSPQLLRRCVSEGAMQLLNEVGTFLSGDADTMDVRPLLLSLRAEELASVACSFQDALGEKWKACRREFAEWADQLTQWVGFPGLQQMVAGVNEADLRWEMPLYGWGGRYVSFCCGHRGGCKVLQNNVLVYKKSEITPKIL